MWIPSAAMISSKLPQNFLSRSWMSDLTGSARSSRLKVKFRACWTTQARSGLVVQPATQTRLVASSMNTNTVDRAPRRPRPLAMGHNRSPRGVPCSTGLWPCTAADEETVGRRPGVWPDRRLLQPTRSSCPLLDFRPQPKPTATAIARDNGAGHIGVTTLVCAHTLCVTKAEKIGYGVSIDQILSSNSRAHTSSLSSLTSVGVTC